MLLHKAAPSARKISILLIALLAIPSRFVALAPIGMINEPLTQLAESEQHRADQLAQLYDYVSRVLPAGSHSPRPDHLARPTLPWFGSPQAVSPYFLSGGVRTPTFANDGGRSWASAAARRLGMNANGRTRSGEVRREMEVVQKGRIVPPNTPERYPTTAHGYGGRGDGSSKRGWRF